MTEFPASYVDKREAAKSYRPKAGTMSPGLKRAREPYRVKNAIVGLTLGAFAVGVWAYSISAVKQDVFDDVDEEVEALGAGVVGTAGAKTASAILPHTGTPTTPTGTKTKIVATSISTPSIKSSAILDQVAASSPAVIVRGVLPQLQPHLPSWLGSRLLDPATKTLVSGAPPVDAVGKTGSGRI